MATLHNYGKRPLLDEFLWIDDFDFNRSRSSRFGFIRTAANIGYTEKKLTLVILVGIGVPKFIMIAAIFMHLVGR